MNTHNLPDELPDHLQTPATATFLEQVALELKESSAPLTEKTITTAIRERLARNEQIADKVLNR